MAMKMEQLGQTLMIEVVRCLQKVTDLKMKQFVQILMIVVVVAVVQCFQKETDYPQEQQL